MTSGKNLSENSVKAACDVGGWEVPCREKTWVRQRVRFSEPFYLICPNIRSLYNVGALFRTADALNITRVFLCGYTGCPPRKAIHKVALGAEDAVPWVYRAQAWRVVEQLQARGVQVVALELTSNSVDILDFEPRFPLALLVGNEVQGLSPALLKRAERVVHLPMHGVKESLNVAVAFGAAGYAFNRWRR